jgi:hypothetical protein
VETGAVKTTSEDMVRQIRDFFVELSKAALSHAGTPDWDAPAFPYRA